MTSTEQTPVTSTLSTDETVEMTKHGITHATIDYFYCGDYRYTDLKDAIAQARRQAAKR